MFNKKLVQKALKFIWARENFPQKQQINSIDIDDKEIPLLIHDIFGGEILKTPKKNGWYFYNRIKGERLDFMNLKRAKSLTSDRFEDIPATVEEIKLYFEQEDYTNLYMKFIRVFEEIIGLQYSRSGYTI